MKKDAVRTERASGLSVAGWPLRRKMALALAVPLLLATLFGGLRVLGDWNDYTASARSAEQVTVLEPAVRYLTAAETAMVAAQGFGSTSEGDLIDAVSDLESAADDLQDTASEANLSAAQAEHVDALLEISQAVRGAGADSLGPETWIAQVRQLESMTSQLISSINAELDTPEPRLEQLSMALSGRMSLAMQQALIVTADSTASASQELFSELGVEAAAIDRLAGNIEGAERETAALRTANVRHGGAIRDGQATDLDGRDAYLPYDSITEQLLTGVQDSLNSAASSARNSALVNALITGLALLATIFLALFITKLLLEPIGRVREGALSVARQTLPDAVARIRAGEKPQEIKPIDVHTTEEIGQVARAVDDLHRQAIHLASGEAQLRQTVNAMFVTLSRRSNSLVNQQLAQIERLEQDEEDPKRLESLFRLDHLASRMRRTADSLLILADAPNRDAGAFSLTVGESLQAATSGVQDYQRVQILTHMGTRISEEAAADIVHLLTELVDNALTFSPPTAPVRLDASLSADGATITIVDSGLGVPNSELEQLNADLTHGSEATPETARRMGLFVVSRLAERHGIRVSLARNPEGGMTASVLLPPQVLPELPQPAAGPARPSAAELASGAASADLTPATPVADSSRRQGRSKKADDKAADKAAAKAEKAAEKAAKSKAGKEANAGAAPVASRPGADELLRAPEVTPDRPPLESLISRREPGANMPRTGADAFLPPETSAASGPLFGKRSTPATPTEPASTPEPATPEAPAPAQAADGLAEGAEKVAPVVPITALASRQRQEVEPPAEQPVEEATDTAAAEQAEVEAPVEEPAAAADEPQVDDADPLGLGTTSHAEPEAPEAEAPEAEAPEAEVPASEQDEADEPAVAVAAEPVEEPEPEVDANDPLGLDTPAPAAAEPAPEPVVEEPAAEAPAVEAPVADEPVAEEPAAASGLPQREPGTSTDVPGIPAASTTGGDSPIFKSMRSGWLASPGEGEWHETEVDRGWERASEVAEEAPAAESTSAGLPMRQPGQRLVPGSVAPPTGAKTRDPEAIRRRLQAHSAGVSRGRKATSSTQHTEAGPA